ncbi:MAG TPA: hypothetical protein VGM39_20845 [Kofleriaceae bacterium]|jgi:hypothetical protein
MRYLLALVLLAGCLGDDVVPQSNEGEVITTLTLTMKPLAGDPVVAALVDPDGDGGEPPTIDPINLQAGMMYMVSLSFQNRLEAPPEEITDEVHDEAVDHQVFFTGDAVSGPASSTANAPITQAYADMDANGLPLGVDDVFTTMAGTGDMTVTLRHMPPLNGTKVKTPDAADRVKAGGISALGGETDAAATFHVTVQ